MTLAQKIACEASLMIPERLALQAGTQCRGASFSWNHDHATSYSHAVPGSRSGDSGWSESWTNPGPRHCFMRLQV